MTETQEITKEEILEATKDVPLAPRDSWLINTIYERIAGGGDVKIVTTARDNETNIGKTICNLWLSLNLNPSFDPREQSFFNPDKYLVAYYEGNPGEVLMLEEAEELHKRRSAQNMNVDTIKAWMKGRKNQIISLLSLPSVSSLDKEIKENAHIWLHVIEQGVVRVHSKYIPDYKEGELYNPQQEELEFPNLDTHPAYELLERYKDEDFKDEAEEIKDRLADKEMDKNYLSTGEAAKIAGVTTQTVSNWFDSGEIDGVRVGKQDERRILKESLESYLED